MRVENSIRNFKYSMVSQFITTFMSFFSRTIFIKILGEEYLGINGLFSNILTILSLADMGISTVIIYSMYKPLAENNNNKIKELMNMYKKVYSFIALSVLVMGLCIMPFLEYFIKDVPNIPNLEYIYLLYLLNSVVSYLCAYKISIINADQKGYIVTYKQQLISFISIIIMTLVLIITRNFLMYLIIQIGFSVFSNIYLSKLAEKMYPFIRNTTGYKLSKNEINLFKKDVFAMMLHKIGGVVVNGTDNLIMSSMIGITYVGIYSNYLLIINIIKRILLQFFDAISASIGNLVIEKDNKYVYDIFKRIYFLNFWIYSFCSICLFILLNPFIKLWLNDNYIFKNSIVFLICLIFFIDGMRQTVQRFRNALGIFVNDKYRPLIEAILNLLISVICSVKLGISGIFIGTIVSMIFSAIIEVYILYKYGFEKSIKSFIYIYFKYIVITIVALTVTIIVNSNLGDISIFDFFIKGAFTIINCNLIFLICTFRTKEFKYFKELILQRVSNKILRI